MVFNLDGNKKAFSFAEKIGRKIPDPVIIFILLYALLLITSLILGGKSFSVVSYDGSKTVYEFKYMFTPENIRWIFANAITTNWLSYGSGILGTILIVMLGIGVAEESGLLSALIRKIGASVHESVLPFVIIFIGVMSNIATDVGYLVLLPLAGMLYSGMGKNPIVGMAAAFAGVSAGFSANLIPATVSDVIMGTNAEIFAANQNIPFVSITGNPLNPITMNYYFIAVSTFLLVIVGGIINIKITDKKYRTIEIVNIHENESFEVSKNENRALLFSLAGFILSLIIVALLAFGPLKSFTNSDGKKVTPFLDNIILLVTFIFFVSGAFYGISSGKFKKASDIISAMSKHIGSMSYVIVLTFFCYNFLALLSYTNADIFITGIGASFIQKIGLSGSPVILIVAVIFVTSVINLFVGGLTAKWMLLGPLFIPMLYNVNQSMTPEVVTAAYRVADSCTNTITPLMTYAGLILMYMRKYKDDFTAGNLISMMFPYSAIFLVSWSALLILFVVFKIPLGF